MEYDFIEMGRRLERVHTPRLALRPATLTDAWPLFAATRNPQFNRFLTWSAPDDIDAMLARVDAIVGAARRGDMAAFSAVSLETGAFVGMLRYMRHDSRADALEMGLWVSDRYWHGRVALELGALAVDAAFELTSTIKLTGQARPENRSSCALMQRVGMHEQPRTVRRLEDGSTVTACEFLLTRGEWASRRRRAFGYYGLDGAMSSFDGHPVDPADDDVPPREPPARLLAIEALRVAAASAASTVAIGAALGVARPAEPAGDLGVEPGTHEAESTAGPDRRSPSPADASGAGGTPQAHGVHGSHAAPAAHGSLHATDAPACASASVPR